MLLNFSSHLEHAKEVFTMPTFQNAWGKIDVIAFRFQHTIHIENLDDDFATAIIQSKHENDILLDY
jgi:hypothetical protein